MQKVLFFRHNATVRLFLFRLKNPQLCRGNCKHNSFR